MESRACRNSLNSVSLKWKFYCKNLFRRAWKTRKFIQQNLINRWAIFLATFKFLKVFCVGNLFMKIWARSLLLYNQFSFSSDKRSGNVLSVFKWDQGTAVLKALGLFALPVWLSELEKLKWKTQKIVLFSLKLVLIICKLLGIQRFPSLPWSWTNPIIFGHYPASAGLGSGLECKQEKPMIFMKILLFVTAGATSN